MKVSIITLFEELYNPFLQTSLMGRARKEGKATITVSSLFNYHKPGQRIDAPAYGHGAGMLIKPEVVERAIEYQEQVSGPSYKIFFSPHGTPLNQHVLEEIYKKISVKGHVMLLPARYEGMDERVESYYADDIISIGDFVLMGGDLPAMMFLEALFRLIPGVVGKAESVKQDSFSNALVDYPHYTEPVDWKGQVVPAVVRSGNHKELEQWRESAAVKRTVFSHFDWFRSHQATVRQEKLCMETIPGHYVALMHSQVKLPYLSEGTTSVTSIDVHDIARSSRTYGFKKYFVVTPLLDQQKIIKKLLDFWASPEGGEYNRSRQEALEEVMLVSALEDVVENIKLIEGKEPVLVGTSARMAEYGAHANRITYYDQKKVWDLQRPVLFLLGTGLGLSTELLKKCDFMLPPVRGFSDFNHLSVRSAASVVFDRWLGSNVKNVNKE